MYKHPRQGSKFRHYFGEVATRPVAPVKETSVPSPASGNNRPQRIVSTQAVRLPKWQGITEDSGSSQYSEMAYLLCLESLRDNGRDQGTLLRSTHRR